MDILNNEQNTYSKYFNCGKDKVYNRKIKIINGKNKQKVIIKEYKNVLGSTNEYIDNYNFERKIQELKSDTFLKAIIDEKEKKIKSEIAVNNDNNKSESKRIRKDNLIRSRNKVFDLARCNDDCWKSFITLTFKENIKDVEKGFDLFNKWLKSVRKYLSKNNVEFFYLAVPEFQKRGALHYHILTNIECGTLIIPLQEGKDNMYDVKFWEHGYSSAFNIINDTDDAFDVAKYMCKYMLKENDDIRLKEHKRYYHSRNLKKPVEYVYMDYDADYQSITHYLMNSHNYEIINSYHHEPKEKYEREYDLLELETVKSNDINILDIVSADLEF